MLEIMTDLPDGIDGVKATGKVSRDDYARVLNPLVEAARRDGRRLRFLYQLGPELESFTPGAAWEDARLGLSNLRLFEAIAVVTDVGWIRDSVRLFAFMMPCPVKTFAVADRAAAVAFLRSLADRVSVVTRIIPESGVMVVTVTHALRAQDIDAVALTADTWIESHGRLQGLVIHAREFPGWENLGALLRHIRFIREHHRKINRIAVAADAKIAAIGPKVAEHFVAAEVKAFTYEQLDDAIAWAGQSKN